jgi:MYXO-CTERM domain-containing protein
MLLQGQFPNWHGSRLVVALVVLGGVGTIRRRADSSGFDGYHSASSAEIFVTNGMDEGCHHSDISWHC